LGATFSTMILGVVDTAAMVRAADSQYARSAALPAPMPCCLVGVFTLTNTQSASAMCFFTSVEKNRFFWTSRAWMTTSSRRGS